MSVVLKLFWWFCAKCALQHGFLCYGFPWLSLISWFLFIACCLYIYFLYNYVINAYLDIIISYGILHNIFIFIEHLNILMPCMRCLVCSGAVIP